MAEDSEYTDILDNNVDEVKKQIRDLEDADYEELLKLEEEGKDRKTVKEFLEQRIDQQDVEVEEVAEEVKEDEASGAFSSLEPKYTFAAAGVVIGLLLGVALGAFGPLSPVDAQASSGEVQDKVEQYWTAETDAAGFEGDITVADPEVRNQMYFVEITTEGTVGEEEVEQSQALYVTLDGELMFPEVRQMGQVVSPIPLDEAINQAGQQQQPEQELSEEDLEELEEQMAEQQQEEQ